MSTDEPTDDVTPVNGVDVLAIIDAAQPAQRSLDLCLRGDLVSEYEALDRKREEAEKTDTGDSLAGSAAVGFVALMEVIREQMIASTITVVLRALPRREFAKLCGMHPVRRDEDGTPNRIDLSIGVNTDTIWDPLIRACWASPDIDRARMKRLLDEKLSNKQYEQLSLLAWETNQGDVDVPFSYAASRTRQRNSPE